MFLNQQDRGYFSDARANIFQLKHEQNKKKNKSNVGTFKMNNYSLKGTTVFVVVV